MFPERGSTIAGRYELERQLDRGGMGLIWVARERASSERHAVKFIGQALPTETALRRFRREAKALERIDNPHVVRFKAHGVDRGIPFIAMELLEGESLQILIERRTTLTAREVASLIEQAALGLGAAHAEGIVHRDVKPSNLFICNGDVSTLKVIDFGIAKGNLLEAPGETGTTGLVGSPSYMSPEQARGESVDHRSDVWALGVLAFRLLTGREPFTGNNVPETLQRICSGKVPKASDVVEGFPSAFDAFFEKALAQAAEARHPTAQRLSAELGKLCAEFGSSLPKPKAGEVRAGPLSPATTRSVSLTTRDPEINHFGADQEHAIVSNRSLVTIVLRGIFSKEIASMCYRAVEDMAETFPGRASVLVVIEPSAGTPSPEARAQTAATMSKVADRINGWAVVVEGSGLRPTLVRSVLVALHMMSRSPLETKYFETVDGAAVWLAAMRGAELSAAEIRKTAEFARRKIAEGSVPPRAADSKRA